MHTSPMPTPTGWPERGGPPGGGHPGGGFPGGGVPGHAPGLLDGPPGPFFYVWWSTMILCFLAFLVLLIKVVVQCISGSLAETGTDSWPRDRPDPAWRPTETTPLFGASEPPPPYDGGHHHHHHHHHSPGHDHHPPMMDHPAPPPPDPSPAPDTGGHSHH
ncbi:hypothetical protein PWT90_00467 [Aphanocladium album]|nr:hypothetical protein PWT90_00467 [Aphanocladium album]